MTDFVSADDYLNTNDDAPAPNNPNAHSIFSTVPDAFKFGYTSANADEEDAIDEKVGKYEPDLVRKTFGGLNALAKNARDTIETNDPEAVTGNGLGTPQRWADKAAGFIGSMLTPVSIASAGLGKIGMIGESILASMVTREAPTFAAKVPKFIKSFASHATSGALGFAAFDTPSALIHGHNASDVVSDISESGAFGMAVSIVPFVWGQIFKEKVPHRTLPGNADSAGGADSTGGNDSAGGENYTPKHTDEENDFMRKYEAGGKKITPELTDLAKSIATKRGIEFNDVTGKTSVPIIPKNDIENMQHAILDQMNRGLDGDLKNALSDFITAKNLDRLSADDTSINGLRGFVDHVQSKVANKDESFKAIDEAIAHQAENETGEVEDKNPISQQKLVEGLKDFKGDMKDLPINIPKRVREFISENKKDFSDYIDKYVNQKFERISTDKDLMEHDFYHGSGRLKDVKEFDITQAAEDSLYGQGLYITDDKKVALSYSKVRARKRIMLETLSKDAKVFSLRFKKQPNLIDVEKAPTPKVFEILSKQLKVYDYEFHGDEKKQPIHETFNDLKESIYRDYESDQSSEIYYGFINNLNNALHDAGYDGYLHTGGLATGQKIKHNVAVLFGQMYHNETKGWVSKNPADLLEQHTHDISQDFIEKVQKFKQILGRENYQKIKALETYISQNEEYIKRGIGDKDDVKKIIERTEAEIKELQKNFTKPLLSPKEELQSIRDKLLPNSELVNDVTKHEEYKRLTDLSKVWGAAETLKDRIDLEESLNREKAFADMADQLVKLADQKGDAQLADLQKVYDYLQQEPDAVKSTHEQEEQARVGLDRAREIPPDIERQLADMLNAIVDDEDSKKGFSEAADTFKELKASEGVFKNLIGCIMGTKE